MNHCLGILDPSHPGTSILAWVIDREDLEEVCVLLLCEDRKYDVGHQVSHLGTFWCSLAQV